MRTSRHAVGRPRILPVIRLPWPSCSWRRTRFFLQVCPRPAQRGVTRSRDPGPKCGMDRSHSDLMRSSRRWRCRRIASVRSSTAHARSGRTRRCASGSTLVRRPRSGSTCSRTTSFESRGEPSGAGSSLESDRGSHEESGAPVDAGLADPGPLRSRSTVRGCKSSPTEAPRRRPEQDRKCPRMRCLRPKSLSDHELRESAFTNPPIRERTAFTHHAPLFLGFRRSGWTPAFPGVTNAAA